MTSNREQLSPELIRRTALKILSKNEGGMRQIELFNETELELSREFLIPEHAIKNALWNLAESNPTHVRKRKLSARNVILIPSQELIDIMAEAFPEEDSKKDNDEIGLHIRLNILKYKIIELSDLIEEADLEDILVEIQQKHLEELTISEQDAIVGLKMTLREIRDYRNIIAHGQLIRGR